MLNSPHAKYSLRYAHLDFAACEAGLYTMRASGCPRGSTAGRVALHEECAAKVRKLTKPRNSLSRARRMRKAGKVHTYLCNIYMH